MFVFPPWGEIAEQAVLLNGHLPSVHDVDALLQCLQVCRIVAHLHASEGIDTILEARNSIVICQFSIINSLNARSGLIQSNAVYLQRITSSRCFACESCLVCCLSCIDIYIGGCRNVIGNYLIKASRDLDWENFRDMPCYIGVDLASTSDLTAVSYLVVDDCKYYFRTDYYLPEAALREKPDRELYKYWKQMGLLKITEGNVTDYDYITNDIMKYSNLVSIQKVGYDKYNAT